MTANKQTILITGTSSGLGQALFDTLAQQDISLFCISRSFAESQERLAEERSNITLLKCDLSDPKEVSSCVKKLKKNLEHHTDIIFINNAAVIRPVGFVGTFPDGEIASAIHINLHSPMTITNVLCGLKECTKLTIINISTGAARIPIAGWSLYCATKAAIGMFFDVLQKQDAPGRSIVVHHFDPGVMDTPMQAAIRNTPSAQFPRVEEFKRYKAEGTLTDPVHVAARLVKEYIRL